MIKLLKNNVIVWVTGLVLVGGIVGGSVLAAGNYGADSVKKAEDFTLEEMLVYAIEDEYLARADYEAIMKKYGEQRPFSNIIKAEETHIEELLPLFAEYEIEVPEDKAGEYVVVPDSIEEALEVGVQAEMDNITMYKLFLSRDIPEDVRDVFENLKQASEKHLTAFERGTNRGQMRGQYSNLRYGQSGRGRRPGQGRLAYSSVKNSEKEECNCNCEGSEEMSEGMRWFINNEGISGQ